MSSDDVTVFQECSKILNKNIVGENDLLNISEHNKSENVCKDFAKNDQDNKLLQLKSVVHKKNNQINTFIDLQNKIEDLNLNTNDKKESMFLNELPKTSTNHNEAQPSSKIQNNTQEKLKYSFCSNHRTEIGEGSCHIASSYPKTSSQQSLESRPIYPNVSYSPYGSPLINKRRPQLRESKRISIEKSGSFLQLNQYKLMDQIGQGSYGLVKLAYSEEDSTHYAMKILSKRRLLRQAGLMKRGPKKITSPLDRVYREIAVLKKLDHPNVVKLIEVLDDPNEDSLYMVFELVKLGEVLNIPTNKPLSENRTWSVFRDVILGLEYLHYQRIIHADLKPANLLQTECGRVKIADLGVCNEFIGEDANISNGTSSGTPAFRAPETLNIGKNMYCGKGADIWSLGITLYSLVFGNVPYLANSIPVLYEKIKSETVSFPIIPKISDDLKDCILCMLLKEPSTRIKMSELKNHSWVVRGGSHPLPVEEENCCLVEISEEDLNSVIRSIPKLDTLILIKTMLKNHSFGNPFLKEISQKTVIQEKTRLDRFVRAGRSRSAPDTYNTMINMQTSLGEKISNCNNDNSDSSKSSILSKPS